MPAPNAVKIGLLLSLFAIVLAAAVFPSVSRAQQQTAESGSTTKAPSGTMAQSGRASDDPSPVQTLIVALKAQRDALPASGTDIQKEQRNIIDQEIAALDKVGATAQTSDTRPVHDEISAESIWAIIGAVLAVFGAVFLAWLAWGKASKAAGINAKDDAYARVRLALAVTLGAMSFIVLVSVVMLLFAGINAALPPWKPEKTQLFFDMGKYILGAVLPVVGAWVGGVLAYYFGKDNFTAGVQSTAAVVKQLTPRQKLASLLASQAGLTVGNIKPLLQLVAGQTLQSVDLTGWKDAKIKFGGQERLPMFDVNGCPLACLHYSTLAKYLATLDDAAKSNNAAMTLGALEAALSWDPDASFATVLPTDDLSVVQTKLNDSKACEDVFVTADGTKAMPVLRWITDQDIVKVANM